MSTGPFFLVSRPALAKRPITIDRTRIERISNALADETRLLIFEAISNRQEMNCGQIVSLREVTPATVSRHLRILMDAGLVETRKEASLSTAASIRKRSKPTPARFLC